MTEEIKKQAKIVAAKYGATYDERQDIEGRCLETAWKAQPKLNEGVDPSAYLLKAMERTALSYLRSKHRKHLPLLEEAHELFSDLTYEKMISNTEAQEKWTQFIELIASPDKEIITLLVKGIDIAEISQTLLELGIKISPTGIRSRISRGRLKWQKIYKNLP